MDMNGQHAWYPHMSLLPSVLSSFVTMSKSNTKVYLKPPCVQALASSMSQRRGGGRGRRGRRGSLLWTRPPPAETCHTPGRRRVAVDVSHRDGYADTKKLAGLTPLPWLSDIRVHGCSLPGTGFSTYVLDTVYDHMVPHDSS